MKVRIKEIAEMRGFKTAYELSERSDLSYPTADRAFRNDIKQFTPDTLERLCKTLFCTPNDIFGVDADAPHYPPLTGEKPISPEIWKRLSKAAQAEHEKNRELLSGKEWRDKLKEKRKNGEPPAADEKPQGEKFYYTKSRLKERGWTDAKIKDLLGEADIHQRRQFGRMIPRYYYEVTKIEAIEKTKEFEEWMRTKKKP